jgi:molybdate/tungstate transport system substrate-binding protein
MDSRYALCSLLGLVLGLCWLTGCSSPNTPPAKGEPAGKPKEGAAPIPSHELTGDLIIFHAGSLSVPFKEVSAEFMKRNPKVTVKAEAAGSRDCARKVSDLKRPCDLLGSADYDVPEKLLMPQFADFNICFATNQLGIACTEKSKDADRIDGQNWPEIFLKDGVAFGRADPNSDPCGYRTVMMFQLAEKHYKVDGLAKRLIEKDGNRFIRPKETDLLALLEAGEIDYLIIYRSVIEQHKLKRVQLPAEINLSAPEHAAFYATASVEVSGKKPGEKMTIRALPILYSVTIPKDAPHRPAAEAYLAFLLGPEGQAIMKKHGQGNVAPALTKELDQVPASVRDLCKKWE